MSKPSLSVALCTYQGERYLQEQLDSIAGQTRQPDELVICDDRSTDGTAEILERFQSHVRFPVKLHVNEKRLGSTKNFEKAIVLCEGDIIFLGDQDDVWHPEKLSALSAVFTASPNIGAAFSDGDLVNERLVPVGQSVWEAIGFTAPLKRKFANGAPLDVLLKRQVVSGMTMAFRARFRDIVHPIPPDWFHDRWISVLIAATSEIAMVPLRLVKYRQHGEQAIGIARKGIRDNILEKRRMEAASFLHFADQYAEARQRLEGKVDTYPCSSKVLEQFAGAIEHMRARALIRSGGGRFRMLLTEALSLNYQRYSNGWRSIAMDAFVPSRSA